MAKMTNHAQSQKLGKPKNVEVCGS